MEESRYDRRFVLPMVPEWINHSDNPEVDCVAIEQGYLMAGENEELRIRREKNKYTITHKIGHGPLCETGFEKLPNKQAFNILLQLVKGRPIHKNRFIFNIDRQTKVEIDAFSNSLVGLVIMEVKTKVLGEFVLPDWAEGAREITGDTRYYNRELALHGIPQ